MKIDDLKRGAILTFYTGRIGVVTDVFTGEHDEVLSFGVNFNGTTNAHFQRYQCEHLFKELVGANL